MENKIKVGRLRNLRHVAIIEGISYLVLLGIAMPLKYLADMPEVVKVVGWMHGVLFIWFIIVLAIAQFTFKWPFQKPLWAFISSLIPFGTFVLDKQLKKEENALKQKL